MKNWRTLTAVAASVALLAGCTTNPYTGEQQAGKVGVYGGLGAVAGAAVGAATSSKKDRKKGALIGAAVGGLAAGGYGAYVDQQEAKLRQTLVNSGVQVQRQGDNLILIMPGNITFASSSADISASFYDTLNSLVLVFKEFNKNVAWDKLVSDLVTASGTVEENPAVTYFLANRAIDKLTDTTTQHFMGIQLQCAQCHNHPFTDWKQTEYWGMAEFFARVQPQNPKNGNKGGDNTKIGVQEGANRTKAKDFFPESAKAVAPKFLGGPEQKLDPTQPARPILARWMTAPDNPFFAKAIVNRTWGMLFGTGFVNPIDDMHEKNDPSHPELLDALHSHPGVEATIGGRHDRRCAEDLDVALDRADEQR